MVVCEFAFRTWLSAVRGVVLIAGLTVAATSVDAGALAAPAVGRLDPIVVSAKKHAEPVPDEKLTQQVQAALHADPFFNDAHVTVTVRNGVAVLEGIVFDEWDVRIAMRIARRIAGVKRVVTDFYVPDGM